MQKGAGLQYFHNTRAHRNGQIRRKIGIDNKNLEMTAATFHLEIRISPFTIQYLLRAEGKTRYIALPCI